MSTPKKRRVTLTADNFADYFTFNVPAALVEGMAIGDGGINPVGPEVDVFLQWVALQSATSPDTEYACTHHDAALILEWAGGWHGPKRK